MKFKRLFDITLTVMLLTILILPMLFIALVIRLTSSGDVIYWSKRVGQNGVIFKMPKFRSMTVDAPLIPSHSIQKPTAHISGFGRLIRHSSLDELPQLWSIFKGDMSFVGPRPIIPEESDFIALRREKKIDTIVPGLTGWAQINGRDNLTCAQKIAFDLDYLHKQSFGMDIKILAITLMRVIKRANISH